MPRMYYKKVGAHAVDQRVRKRSESRDAIVWSIDADNDIVNLKIQGSDILYKAYYHQVLTAVPSYCKVGAAVSLRHRRGNKGFAEVQGTGRAIPTPIGSGSSLPDIPLEDMILTGMEVLATDPTTMYVRINSGTYRMNNTIYVFSEANNNFYEMNDPAEIMMGSDPVTMGGDYYVVEVPSAPTGSGYGRYDILVVGPHDGLIDLISGTAVNLSTTVPVMPTIPSQHVLIDWILVQKGDSVVTNAMIGQGYGSPAPEEVTVVISGTYVNAEQQLTWNPGVEPIVQYTCTITISAKDQYGNTYNFGGVRGTLTKMGGYGRVHGGYTGWTSDVAESYASSSVVFGYERDQTETEFSPIFMYEHTGFSTAFVLTILSLTGSPM